MKFNINEVPFSRYGSWLSFSWIEGKFAEKIGVEGLVFRTVRDCGFNSEMFTLQLVKENKVIPFETIATPEKLRIQSQEGYVDICMSEPKIVRYVGNGVTLRLTARPRKGFEYIFPYDDNQYVINAFGARLRLALTPLDGKISVDAPWMIKSVERFILDFVPNEDGIFDMVMQEYKNKWPKTEYTKSFDECVENVANEFDSWLAKQPEVPDEYKEQKELASYVNWSCMVDAEDQIKRPSMLMSKNWMTNVWSWDHCFNSIALSYHYPELAWDQFVTLFDHQDSNGAIPDSINNIKPVWNFLKPPIHGWTLKKLIDNGVVDDQKLKAVYEPLCRWTNWWMNERDYDQDGIPQYDHGNDSGWDNCTLFKLRPPIEAPDLPTFLIIQMEVLSEVAEKLGKHADVKYWAKASKDLFNKFMEHSRVGNKLVTLQSRTHKVVPNNCLLSFMPLLLGDRLPAEVTKELVNGLKKEGYITEWGLATENPNSPDYISDGYWLGPIWAPSTMLLVEGLNVSGEVELAKSISEKFAKMCKKSGFAENYDALTGEGLRDLAYTWTSSVFLILTHEYVK